MELLTVTLVLIFTVTVYLVVRGLRYRSTRTLLLDVVAWLWGVNTYWIQDPVHARLVLQASNDKGLFIERLFATPAWAPVLSLESVDGAQWQRMKRNYLQLAPRLPPTSALQKIVARHVEEHKHQPLDAPAIAMLTISSFYEWLFGRKFLQQEWAFVADAAWEWRKGIAMKGQGDALLKERLVEWFLNQIPDSPLYDVFGDKWKDPEFYSCYLQPFLISPSINVCDIAVAVTDIHHSSTEKMTTIDMIYLALQTQNPFPVLERYLPDGLQLENLTIPPNTQAFIALDDLGRRDIQADPQYRLLVFGNGARSCPGKSIALNMMTALFTEETLSSPLWQPRANHKYSGRNNDGGETPQQVLYLLGIVLKAMIDVACQRTKQFVRARRKSARLV